jgi:serine phosphatase RsbU (regulator of sigma subunit)
MTLLFNIIIPLLPDGLIGTTPFHLVLYSAVIMSVTWLLVRLQLRSLFRTRKLLKEKEAALSVVENRKSVLELKNKDITDSLIYAQRIQEALLPSESALRKHFRDSFIMYRPKDIVSGDFYWIGEKGDRKFIVAADCTGHGVPGALMSMIGHDLLEKFINSENTGNPGMIMDNMNMALGQTFNRERNTSMIIRDGMDMGICAIDFRNKKIEFSGAFFPLFLIRENRLIEIKGDKYTLGMAPGETHFTNNEIDLQNGDIIYLFSDGYVDQFGGEENKKFMYRRFRYLLMNIHQFSMEDQKAVLEDNIKTWMGSNPQVDDILIIGINPL